VIKDFVSGEGESSPDH